MEKENFGDGFLKAFYGEDWKNKVAIRNKIFEETGIKVTISPTAKDYDYESVKQEALKMQARLKEFSDSGCDPIVGERLGLKKIFDTEE